MLDRLWHWMGWGCGMKLLPGGYVEIRCPVCVREFVEPRVLATPCAGCGHVRGRHTGGAEGFCKDCGCRCWAKPSGGSE